MSLCHDINRITAVLKVETDIISSIYRNKSDRTIFDANDDVTDVIIFNL